MVKRCAWGTRRNDSRFQHLQTKNKTGDNITFYCFPAPKRLKETAERRERWIIACHRGDSFVYKFVGQTKPVGQYSLHSRAILAYYKNKWDKFCQFCGKYAI
jgi:hypothetical protein